MRSDSPSFRLLYPSADTAFRDHNFSDFSGGIEKYPYSSILVEMRAYYADPRGGLAPHFEALLEFTLSPESCASFLRANPDLPIGQRDYYLSKLYQLLSSALTIKYELPEYDSGTDDALMEFLNKIPPEVTEKLAVFDWWGFLEETRSQPLEIVIQNLATHLPKGQKPHGGQQRTGQMEERGISPIKVPEGTDWEDIHIRFTSDHRVQITIHEKVEIRTFEEMGFSDRRGRGKCKPDSNWETLTELAKRHGCIRNEAEAGKDWRKVEKAIQTIRRRFRALLGIPGDPFASYKKVKGYQARFKISFPQNELL